MARIADKHGLTNKYRSAGIGKRVVKRGRPRKYLLGSPTSYRKSTKRTTSVSPTPNFTANTEVSAKNTRAGCLILLVAVVVLVVFIVSVAKDSGVGTDAKYVDYAVLQQQDHPVLYDEYDDVKNYYKGYTNVSVGSYQSHKEVDKPVITVLSYLQYDRIYLITINLDNLDLTFTLEEAIDIAIDYIPVDMMLECYEFEKAIYKTKDDGKKQYECFYTLKKDGVEKPGYYFIGDDWIKMQSGLSLIFEETDDGSYIIHIGDDWYESKYSALTTGWDETMEKERATHIEWDFSIEKYISSK